MATITQGPQFLVKGREFYFLEINTRIQVEHPITEAITGVDLVQLQLRVAMGESLPFTQDTIGFSGHAIELRINAEDVCENFRPATGTITSWRRPDCSNIREDCGYRVGDSIPPFYDSLISKVIVHAPTRDEAIYRTFQFLKSYQIEGVPTTIPFHAWILANPDFQGDGIDIGYVERFFSKEGAAQAQAVLALDTQHRPVGPDGVPFCETFSASELPPGRLPSEGVFLVVTHEPGGTFLAVPTNKDGKKLEQSLWRRSNTRQGVLQLS